MGNNGPKTGFNLFQLVGDIALVNLAIMLAFVLRLMELPSDKFAAYLNMVPFVSIIAIFIFNFYGLYHTSHKKWSEILASLIVSIFLLTLVTISMSYMFQEFHFPRSIFFIGAVLQVIMLGVWRWFMLNWEMRMRPPRRVICIAPSNEVDFLVHKLAQNNEKVLGVITSGIEENNHGSFQCLGNFDQSREICTHYRPDAVILSGVVPDNIKEEIVRGSLSIGWEIFVVPSIYEIMISQTELETIEDTPVLKIDTPLNPEREQVKRMLDSVISFTGLVILLPVMLLIALMIKLDSPGPVLYKQERVSRKGKHFMLYKFRTMVDKAEEKTGPVNSSAHDNRVTRVGKLLRFTRLDELPQLYNVLKGDMSMVGPRPERPYFVEQYEQEVSGYSYRHMTKAGITGLAQVMSNHSTSIEDKLRYDLLYTKNHSPLVDIKILLQTMKVVLMRDRAS